MQAQKPNPRFSNGDRLCFNGQKLILKNGPKDASDSVYWAANAEYKTEIDSFAKIVANHNHTQFTVYLKNGLIQTYGDNQGQNSTYYRPGFSSGVISRWSLAKTEDRYGNNYKVYYNYDLNDYEQTIQKIAIDPNVVVRFDYIAKAHPRFGYDKGYKYVKRKLLKQITVEKVNLVSQSHIASLRSYKMGFPSGAVSGGETTTSKFATITECGFKGSIGQDIEECGLPLSLAWPSVSTRSTYTAHSANGGADHPGGYYRDVDGDGYTDHIEEGRVTFRKPSGDVTFGFGGENNHLTPLKFKDGIGFINVYAIERSGENGRYLDIRVSLLRKVGAQTSFTSTLLHTGNNGAIPQALVTDFNNDGLDDVCIFDKCYLQSLTTGNLDLANSWDPLWRTVEHAALDVNSDGLMDRVRGHGLLSSSSNQIMGRVVTDLGTGHGFDNNLDANFSPWDADVYKGQFGILTLSGTYPNQLGISSGSAKTLIDLNGDGLRDLIFINSAKKLSYRLNTGYGLTAAQSTPFTVGAGVGHAKDFNGDGLEDYFHTWGDNNNGYLFVYLTSIENGQIVFTRKPVTGIAGVDANGVCNYQFYPDACKVLADISITKEKLASIGDPRSSGGNYFAVNNKVYGLGSAPNSNNRLVAITDGIGHQTNIAYSNLMESGDGHLTGIYGKFNLYKPQQTAYPYLPLPRSTTVVQYIEQSDGIGDFNRDFYLYEGGKTSATGRGFMAFNKTKVIKYNKDGPDSEGNRSALLEERVYTEYHQDFPYTGRIRSVQIRDKYNRWLKDRYSYYKVHPENPEFVYEARRFEESFESVTDDYLDVRSFPIANQEQSFVFDRYGNLTDVHLIQGVPMDNYPSASKMNVAHPLHHTVIHHGYDINEADHLLGFQNYTSKDTYFEDGSSAKTHCQTFQREPNTLDVSMSFSNCAWSPFNGKVALQNRYIRNNKGVITQVQTTATDINSDYPTRTTTYDNFEDDIYPRSIRNSLGDVTALEYHPRYSAVSKTTDPNGFAAEVTFDAWGRETGRYDVTTGNRSAMGIQACTPQVCPPGAMYFTRSLSTNDASPNKLAAPVVDVFYDQLGRELRQQTHSLAGLVKVDSEYDKEGNVQRRSDPYTGGSAQYWTTFTYDEKRRIKTESSSRFERVLDYASSSLNVDQGIKKTETITSPSPVGFTTQTNVTYHNALGQVLQVVDNMSNTVDYSYDSQGNLLTTTVNNNPDTTITIRYDDVGNKTQIDDPDAGIIDFAHNGFGELRYQTWAPGTPDEKRMEFVYDGLGRKELRVDTDPNGNQERFRWDWDYPLVGALTAAYREADQYGQYYSYDNKGQVTSVSPWGTSGSPQFEYQYDSFGRVEHITYPMAQLSVERKYGAFGAHVRTVNAQNQQPIWELGNIADAQGNLTQQRYGNGVVTQHTYHPGYGTVQKIEAGHGGMASVQSLSYTFDGLGNLHEREVERIAPTSHSHRSERFEYDGLYRLISNGADASSSPCGDNYCYNDLGNLTYKSGVGTLSYHQVNGAGVHAITSGAGRAYQYDAYGNMIQRDTDQVEYDVYNKPTRMRGTYFTYGADHELLRQTSYDTQMDTYYINGLYGEKFEALVSANGMEVYRNYVDGVMLFEGNRWLTSPTTSYLHYDHLGSVDTITDASGNVKDHLSFDPWGERRQDDWLSGDPTMGMSFFYDTQMGYTGHEMLDQFGLVHMGGRVYDPLVSRFMSADLLVQAPFNTQSYNRYSYVFNNPLSYVDPTGYAADKYDDSDPCGGDPNCSVVTSGSDQDAIDRFNRMIEQGNYDYYMSISEGGWRDYANTAGDYSQIFVEEVIDLSGFPVVATSLMDMYVDYKVGNYGAMAVAPLLAAKELATKKAKKLAKALELAKKPGAKKAALPKPPTGPGAVPKSDRDPNRLFKPSEREAKRAEQGHKCANGCGTEVDASNSAGHHIERHADGGRTVPENHAEVCIPCHKNLHSGN